MARLWRRVLKGCKFFVCRRDGSVPTWKHFVLGARDPAAPAGLRAYADKAEELKMDPDYCWDIRDEADAWERELVTVGLGDPDAGPHRVDDEVTVRKMTGEPDREMTWNGAAQLGLRPDCLNLIVATLRSVHRDGIPHKAFMWDGVRFEIGEPAPSPPKG